MAFQSVPDTAIIEFRADLFGENIENTVYVDYTGGYDQTDLDNTAEIAADAWASYMLPQLGGDYIFREVYVKGLENMIDLESLDATHSGEPGTQEGSSVTGNVSFVIKFQTGHTGRSARGRNYVGGLPYSVGQGNTVNSTYADDLVAAYISIMTALNAGGARHVVVSRFSAGAKRSTGLTLPVTIISYTDLNLDSQRGRLAGRGS